MNGLIRRTKRKFFAGRAAVLQSDKGSSLIELLITLAVFAVVTAMIYSVFSGFLKHATTERRVAKTELDLVNVSWPLIKELQSAGFGVPTSGTCLPAEPSVSGSEITIHSTAAGDDQDAGAWSYVSGSNCATTIGPNKHVVVINSLDNSFLVSTGTDASGNLSSCTSDYKDAVAYWTPLVSAGELECYETKYALMAYITADRPAACAPGAEIQKLSRSVARTTTTSYQPVLDCVRDSDYRFGCVDVNGNLNWRTDPICGTSKLRLMKVGLIVQSSTRRDTQVQADVNLFEDLGSTLKKTVTLTNDQRYYKWEKREILITLRNLE